MAGGSVISAPHVKISLISEENAIAPRTRPETWLGFYFQLEPGWHVYWINPGDSGAPPRVTWKLPPGFSVGPLQWPYPERIPTSSLMDYGYQGSVLLMAQLHAPSAAGAGSVPVVADLHWLVCRELCLPGRAELQFTLPVAAAAAPNPETHLLFEAARQRLPRPAPAQWKLSVQSRNEAFLLQIGTGRREPAVSFFPLEPGQIEDAAPQILHRAPGGASLELKKSDELLQALSSLSGVVVISGRAYVVNAPVRGEQPVGN